MKKIILSLIAICSFGMAAAQIVIPRQDIRYNVKYHWGIIDVMIASGVVTVEGDSQNFYGTLDGTSIPWEGKIICVSDTLRASMSEVGGQLHEQVTYQSGWYRRPSAAQFQGSSYNPENPAIYRNIAGQGAYDASDDSMEAITVTSDMIGMYYYAHAIDFSRLRPGDRVEVGIDGLYSKELVITYQGEGLYTVDGDTYPTYNCSFEYGYGGRMSGYPVDCKISVRDRIPVYLGANLPVGRVEMLWHP